MEEEAHNIGSRRGRTSSSPHVLVASVRLFQEELVVRVRVVAAVDELVVAGTGPFLDERQNVQEDTARTAEQRRRRRFHLFQHRMIEVMLRRRSLFGCCRCRCRCCRSSSRFRQNTVRQEEEVGRARCCDHGQPRRPRRRRRRRRGHGGS